MPVDFDVKIPSKRSQYVWRFILKRFPVDKSHLTFKQTRKQGDPVYDRDSQMTVKNLLWVTFVRVDKKNLYV